MVDPTSLKYDRRKAKTKITKWFFSCSHNSVYLLPEEQPREGGGGGI